MRFTQRNDLLLHHGSLWTDSTPTIKARSRQSKRSAGLSGASQSLSYHSGYSPSPARRTHHFFEFTSLRIWICILRSIHQRQHCHQGSRRYVSSFAISSGSKTLRPDLVRAVAKGAKEANSTFYEWCRPANVASGGKI